jgi:hypothetical protein
MRTTLSLDDDVFELAKRYAEARSLAFGKALSELVRRGLNSPPKTREVNGLMVFDLPDQTPKVSTGHVKKLEAETW